MAKPAIVMSITVKHSRALVRVIRVIFGFESDIKDHNTEVITMRVMAHALNHIRCE